MKPNPYAQKAQKNREDMALEHAHLIKRVVGYMAARLPPGIEQDDLYQAGFFGLMDAINKFDSEKDVQFNTYAEFRIKGAILDELRAMDWVPRSVRSAAHQLEEAHSQLTAKLQRQPSDQETAKHLNMSLSDYHDFLAKARPVSIMSFEDFGGGDDDEHNILDILEDTNTDDPFQDLSLREFRGNLVDAIKELPEQEQMILSLYYDEEMNLKEIGEILGVSESRVSQIRTKTIIKLRSMLRVNEEK
ncbi:MAG: FliA/WhiG family RNA polymerase sigma factor [SAR324 cluster bacterium]|nr:FliA/WhiG family RNA polymerase sigma factor [SAR324 cluster bacterium]